jgi:spermidine synthase
MKMARWFTETFEDKLGFTLKVKQTLHSEKTQYQHIDILEMDFFGELKTQYYNQEIHRSAFSLPNFVKEWTK